MLFLDEEKQLNSRALRTPRLKENIPKVQLGTTTAGFGVIISLNDSTV